MWIPRRTKIERAGVVVSAFSLLAVVIGAIAVAPETIVMAAAKPPIVFNQAPGDCIKEVTAQQVKSPQGVGTGDRWSGPTPAEVCYARSEGVVPKLRTLAASEYIQVYAHNVAGAVGDSTVPEGAVLPPEHTYVSTYTVAGPAWRKATELLLYWGVRLLLIGLFLMYCFEATVGRLIRFVWHNSARA